MSDPRSRIPSVDALLGSEKASALVERFGRDRAVDAIRGAVDAIRGRIARAAEDGRLDAWSDRVEDHRAYLEIAAGILATADVPSLRRVINATGVVLHTNLGRAPLAAAAVEAMRAAAEQYTNLEYDLGEGRRGSRYTHCVSLLTELTGAADALVVNNAAGGLVLALNTVVHAAAETATTGETGTTGDTATTGDTGAARDRAVSRGVAVSRGELVEIGGGFRIPEVLERSGARLVEVGSTNRTRVDDYRKALDEQGAVAVLKVHRSNFRITGFTEEATVAELSELAREAGVPLIHDLGSGLMLEASELGLPDEPRARQSLEQGADVVVVSGDKLLGGPQAGLVVGDAEWIGRMRGNPLCRALRVDKAGLAGLEATLRLYRDPERALREIPTLHMLSTDADTLRARAEDLADRLDDALEAADLTGRLPLRVVETDGAVGGGTFPGVTLESSAVELAPPGGADGLARALRDGDPPVVGRIVDEGLRLDVRTVLPGQEEALVRRVVESVHAPEGGPAAGSGQNGRGGENARGGEASAGEADV